MRLPGRELAAAPSSASFSGLRRETVERFNEFARAWYHWRMTPRQRRSLPPHSAIRISIFPSSDIPPEPGMNIIGSSSFLVLRALVRLPPGYRDDKTELRGLWTVYRNQTRLRGHHRSAQYRADEFFSSGLLRGLRRRNIFGQRIADRGMGNKRAVRIGASPWKRLPSKTRGNRCAYDLCANRGASWGRFSTIEDTIAAEDVDRYCTYRLLSFQYNYSSNLRECQRDLSSFSETVLVNSQNYAWGCVNCHMPMNNDPNRFVLQSRSSAYGSETLIADNDSITTLVVPAGVYRLASGRQIHYIFRVQGSSSIFTR